MASASSIPGTNVPPVSFPGIASGIDYNSIIAKLTSLSLEPTVSLNQQIATLNAANTELIKINSLLASVQSSLTELSQPDLYSAVSAASSNPADATAQGIPGVYAAPGVYTVESSTLATPTVVTGGSNIGHVITDAMPGTATSGADVPLIDSWAAITPTNGPAAQGSVTINGVTVKYDVTTQSLNTILANINSAVRTATGDSTFTISLSGNVVQISDANNPISLGAGGDQGNLLQVLRLDRAHVVNTASSGSVTATGGVGGVNEAADFSNTNALGEATNANYLTAVTSGTFTINGVQIAVKSNNNLFDVINSINASSAGVVASYDSATGQITLAAKNSGPQSIVLGSGSDTSNFLSATGLTPSSGATSVLGTQASVTIKNPSGGTQTIYSNSNDVTTAIPGVQIDLLAAASSPFQIDVSQDSSGLVSAINTFVSAYNTAINEINTSTAPPIVTGSSGSGGSGTASVGGGVLYGNADVQSVKDELVNMVSSLDPNGGAYNSLSTIGLQLTSSFTQLAADTSGSSTQPISAQTFAGTDGQLQALDVAKLQSALAANPTAVQNLIAGASGVAQQIGAYLTGVTGMPTQLSAGLAGTIPQVSLIQGFENANSSSIQSIQQQVKQIQDNVNMQADQLRQEFVASEAEIAQLQSLQSQLGSFFGSGSSSSTGH